MHVLILGGTRFVGRLLAWRLLAGGHRVTLLNRGTRPDPFGARVERLRADRTTDQLDRALAGRTFGASVDFSAYVRADAERAVRVLRDRTGHHVFVSSGQVYLVRAGCPRPSRESDFDGPLIARPGGAADQAEWDYGAGKREAEEVLDRAFRDSRFPSTRIRIPIVHGEGDPSGRLEAYLWRLLDGGPLLLPEGGAAPVRHVYAGSVVEAIAALLGRASTHGKAYNLAQDETPTLAELVTLLGRELGAAPRLVRASTERLVAGGLEPRTVSPLSSPWASFLEPGLARAELGFRHKPLEDYLGRVVASFLAHVPAEPPASYAASRPLERAFEG